MCPSSHRRVNVGERLTYREGYRELIGVEQTQRGALGPGSQNRCEGYTANEEQQRTPEGRAAENLREKLSMISCLNGQVQKLREIGRNKYNKCGMPGVRTASYWISQKTNVGQMRQHYATRSPARSSCCHNGAFRCGSRHHCRHCPLDGPFCSAPLLLLLLLPWGRMSRRHRCHCPTELVFAEATGRRACLLLPPPTADTEGDAAEAAPEA